MGHLARAVALASDEHQRCEIQLAEAQACNDAGKYEQALALAEPARSAFEAMGETDAAALAAAAWCVATTRLAGDLQAAVAKVEPYMRALLDIPGKEAVLNPVLYAYLLAYNGLGGNDYDLMLRAIKLADRLGDRAQLSRSIGNLGVQLMRAGLEELGIVLFEKSAAVAREAGDIAQLAFGLSNLASALAQRDAVAAALVADEAMDGAQRSGIAAGRTNALVNLAIGRWATGDWDTVLRAVGSEWLSLPDQAVVAPVAALVLAARGQDPFEVVDGVPEVDETLCYLDLARAVAQAFAGDRLAVSTVGDALTAVYDISGLYEDFTLFYGAAVHIADQFADGALLDRLRAVVDDDGSSPPAGLAGHRALVGAFGSNDVDSAEAAFRAALTHYGTWGSTVHLTRARSAYAVWLTRQGRAAEAEPLVAEARATYADLGAVAWLEELEQGLAAQRVGT